MTNGNDRLDRVERILENLAQSQKRMDERQEQFTNDLDRVDRILQELAARQQYHDEAFERHDAQMKLVREAQAIAGEHILALVRIVERHDRRLDNLEGGEAG